MVKEIDLNEITMIDKVGNPMHSQVSSSVFTIICYAIDHEVRHLVDNVVCWTIYNKVKEKYI